MKGGLRPLDLRGYLKLGGSGIPWVDAGRVYEKLKLEMSSEIVFGNITNQEDIRQLVLEYNDKWNDIREEALKLGAKSFVLPEDFFQEMYASESYEAEALKKQDEFFSLNEAVHKIPEPDKEILDELHNFMIGKE